jgi:hypothetical protein
MMLNYQILNMVIHRFIGVASKKWKYGNDKWSTTFFILAQGVVLTTFMVGILTMALVLMI